MKMLRILILIFLSIYNPLWAQDSSVRYPDHIIVTKGNMISLMKLNAENNTMLLKDQEGGLERFLDLMFKGIVDFEKGRRRDDPKNHYKEKGREVAV